MITALQNTADVPTVQECPVAPPSSTQVEVRLLEDEARAVQEALDRAAQGEQVLWIENTVDAAQQRYLDLAARAQELGVACGLPHARGGVSSRWIKLFS